MSIKWQDMVPDTEVLTRVGIPSIHTILQKAQVRWAGHVTRMSDGRLPKQLLYGELCYGKRSLGGQNGCLMAACQNSSYRVSSATENDHLVGKINASRTPLRRPSQVSTLMSPTGKYVPRIEPCGEVCSILEQEQQKQTGSRRLRKSALPQSETLPCHQHFSRPDIPMPRVCKNAAGPNWTD